MLPCPHERAYPHDQGPGAGALFFIPNLQSITDLYVGRAGYVVFFDSRQPR